MSKANYVNGDTVTAQILRLANPATISVAIEIKVWFEAPTSPPITFVNLGADGSVVLSAGFNQDFGPRALFQITPAMPRGPYAFSCRIIEPVTGELLTEELNVFMVQ